MKENLGDRIKNRRLFLKLTQEELAKKLEYTSKSTINKIEKGINDIPLSRVKDFARALETTEQYIMGWEKEEKKEKYSVDTSVLTPEELQAFENATAVNKQLFFNNIEDEHDMAVFKQAVIELLIKNRENKNR